MFHILIGFESHRKDSPGTAIYTGHDPEEVKKAVAENLPKFGVIRLYKNAAWSKRWNQGDITEAPATDTPVNDVTEVNEIPESPEEATATEEPESPEESTTPEPKPRRPK